LGVLAWKSIVLFGHYFGFWARLLTKNEDMAKGGEKQRVGELASWRVSMKLVAGGWEREAGSLEPEARSEKPERVAGSGGKKGIGFRG
jgi:hypothetical protein